MAIAFLWVAGKSWYNLFRRQEAVGTKIPKNVILWQGTFCQNWPKSSNPFTNQNVRKRSYLRQQIELSGRTFASMDKALDSNPSINQNQISSFLKMCTNYSTILTMLTTEEERDWAMATQGGLLKWKWGSTVLDNAQQAAQTPPLTAGGEWGWGEGLGFHYPSFHRMTGAIFW